MTRLAAARLRAADAQPFLALALYALTPVADPGRGTFAVDEEWRIRVDPAALANWSVDECAGVFLHEVGHVVRGHASRARACGISDSTARLWNLAADAEINDDLVDDDVVLPARPVVPATLGEPPHRAAEYYFHRLPQPVRSRRLGHGAERLERSRGCAPAEAGRRGGAASRRAPPRHDRGGMDAMGGEPPAPAARLAATAR